MTLRISFSGERKPETGNPAPLGCHGFSLLEVLVATALMGLVMVVLLQVLGSTLKAQEASRRNTQALLVAESLLQECCASRVMENRTFQGQTGRYDYQVLITPQFEVADAMGSKAFRCALIKVTVSWREMGRTKSLHLETMRSVALKRS